MPLCCAVLSFVWLFFYIQFIHSLIHSIGVSVAYSHIFDLFVYSHTDCHWQLKIDFYLCLFSPLRLLEGFLLADIDK